MVADFDPDTMFDCQVELIHEYKRQLLNASRIVVLYNQLHENPEIEMQPRTFFFGGKAAPVYMLGGVALPYWEPINSIYRLKDRHQMAFVNEIVDRALAS